MTRKTLLIRFVFIGCFFSLGLAYGATNPSNSSHSFSQVVKEIAEKIEHLTHSDKQKKLAAQDTLPTPSITNTTSTNNTKSATENQTTTTSTKSEEVNVESTPGAKPADSSAIKRYENNTKKTNNAQNITLNFTNVPVRELIQVFAQFTGLNFIISDNVKGNMSIHLENIPWPQALNAILTSQNLGQRRVGNAIIVAPINEIADQQAKELEAEQRIEQLKYAQEIANLQAEQRIEDLQPLTNQVVRLKYAKAADIKDLLTKDGSLLSPRGKVGIDNSSNTVWIRDTEKHATSLARVIRKLDTPVKQVLIEARIVKIERPYEKSLGIRWGVTSVENNLSGTLEGANQIVGGTQPASVTPLSDRLNFDHPASSLNNGALSPSTVGLALSVLGNFKIDLELSALEYEGKLETISKPRLITSNLQPAKITNGEEIPYQEASSSGATSVEFKEASLTLEVTPRITPDNRVILDVKVSNDAQGNTVPVGTGTAVAITTEQEESQVLLDNGQTVVLGGVFKLDKRKTVTRVPFFGQIPIVGYLFKQSVWRNTRTELLIFLTPKIINKPSDLNEE